MIVEKILIGFLSIFGIVGTIMIISFYNSNESVGLFIGSIFALLGWGIIIPIIYKLRIQSSVKKHGITLYTDVINIISGNLTLNNADTYRIRTQWLDEKNHTLYYFQSNLLLYNPEDYLHKIDKIPVMVNPNNFNQNYMDLSFLPTHTNHK